MPKQYLSVVMENIKLTDHITSLRLKADGIDQTAAPGQFIHIRCGEGSLLRRPISICDVKDGLLTVVVEHRGEGTRWLSERQPGEQLDFLGPLGTGFDLSGKNIILVGGGIGVPPMLFAARACAGHTTAITGFRNKSCVILEDALQKVCQEVIVTTDDGSYGEHGTISQPLRRLLSAGGYDGVMACGPKPMLKAAAALCEEYGVPCQVSMEERMGCGIGACLVCACKTLRDGKEEMRHVCKDGPVFCAEEVVW